MTWTDAQSQDFAVWLIAASGGTPTPPPPSDDPPAITAHDCLAGTVPTLPAFTPFDYWTARQNYLHRMMGNVPGDSVIFLGHSVIDALNVTECHPSGINFGIGGDTLAGQLNRIGGYPFLRATRCVVLLDIINDLANPGGAIPGAPDRASARLAWLTGPLVYIKQWRIGNAAIDGAIDYINGLDLAQLAGRSNCVIVDPVTIGLADSASGIIKPEYQLGDNIHPSTAGYTVLIAGLKPAILQAMG
jgi:hypothetical protein